MEDKTSMQIIEKLTDLNQLEKDKAKVMAEIYLKTTQKIVTQKVKSLEENFKDQAKFYGQNLKNYEEIYQKILTKYQEQLEQIINKYNEFYINAQLELQEAECNQKIAITNWKKSMDNNKKVEDSNLEEAYQKKIKACIQKKTNYDVIIQECEKELIACADKMENQVNHLFGDKSSQVSVKDEGAFAKFIHSIVNRFNGANKFNMYVIEPLNVEMEVMDGKLPDIQNNIKENTINFVAKIKQAKDETNKIFNNMLEG